MHHCKGGALDSRDQSVGLRPKPSQWSLQSQFGRKEGYGLICRREAGKCVDSMIIKDCGCVNSEYDKLWVIEISQLRVVVQLMSWWSRVVDETWYWWYCWCWSFNHDSETYLYCWNFRHHDPMKCDSWWNQGVGKWRSCLKPVAQRVETWSIFHPLPREFLQLIARLAHIPSCVWTHVS